MGAFFTIQKKIPQSLGRAGVIETPHGLIHTPAFVNVGTKATVKAVSPEEVRELGGEVVLANTYHLYLQPGHELIRKAGGLHTFMNWPGPMMTDSGGFQVFSLGVAYGKGIGKFIAHDAPSQAELAEAYAPDTESARLMRIDDEGVSFRSHLDGSEHRLSAEKSMEIQEALGADIIFAFDECTSPHATKEYLTEAMHRTHAWAERSLARHQELQVIRQAQNKPTQALFGIVQGGRFTDLRKESARFIGGLNFPGFGIGGSFIKEDMQNAVRFVSEILPEDKPRHLLGVGEPGDLLLAIENGADTFDCVAATRMARNGTIYTKQGTIHIENKEFREDFKPIEEDCGCSTCAHYSKAYIAHLLRAHELLAYRLTSIHNLYFIVHLVKNARQAILEDRFAQFKENFLKQYKND